jgi:hypothetical protein
MPSARRAGVPPEVLQEWEADFRKKKADQQKAGGRKLPSGSVQYEYEGTVYTAKFSGPNRSVSFPEAAYEARVEGQRSRKGEQQKIKLTSMEQLMNDYKYQDADLLTRESGQRHVVDHIDPINKGGFSNAPWNLQVLTEPTNAAKSDTLGGDIGVKAREESRYLANLANQLRGLRGVVNFIGNQSDAIQTGTDIFNQGKTGSEIDQLVQEPFAKVQDPFEAAAEARKRGGKTTVGAITLPELGLSEFFMPPRQ